MVYLGTCSFHLLKACRHGPLQWPGLRCAGPAGLILKLARLAHQDYCRHQLRELTDAPLGGRCGKLTELEGREPTLTTTFHISRYQNGFRNHDQIWLEECWKRVKTLVTTLLSGYTKSWKNASDPTLKNILCICVG